MTINLEKELIRQNRKLVMPEELLAIQEFERNAGLLQNDTLERVGMLTSVKAGKELKKTMEGKHSQTINFKQERVFHISQIKAICEKYYLRFLPSYCFSGSIDPELITKIVNFEAAYGVRCHSVKHSNYVNTFIVAPQESFNLQERPKDPLFFYKINDEYFYLIHKWGNDLNVSRRLLSFFTSTTNSILTVWTIFSIVCATILSYAPYSEPMKIGFGTFMGLMAVVCLVLTITFYSDDDAFFRKNRWDDEYDEYR